VLNILREGRSLRRHFQKTSASDENVFANLATELANNGCQILTDALSYLECTVQSRMQCGDHWLIYATTGNGKVMDLAGITAVNHRKSGNQY
jgi:flavin reductase (DIM6/NTAB) family NADH-FMN oxidoreductase RutF